VSRGTTHRTVRVEDDLWFAAKEKADAEGVKLSDVLRDALRSYITTDACTASGEQLQRSRSQPTSATKAPGIRAG